jgi:hypothetical protein
MQNGTATLKDSSAESYNTKLTLTIQFSIVLLGIYPKGLKTHVYTQICRHIFTTTLFQAKTLKQPRCSSIEEF